jgi:hypothetical protein
MGNLEQGKHQLAHQQRLLGRFKGLGAGLKGMVSEKVGKVAGRT